MKAIEIITHKKDTSEAFYDNWYIDPLNQIEKVYDLLCKVQRNTLVSNHVFFNNIQRDQDIYSICLGGKKSKIEIKASNVAMYLESFFVYSKAMASLEKFLDFTSEIDFMLAEELAFYKIYSEIEGTVIAKTPTNNDQCFDNE